MSVQDYEERLGGVPDVFVHIGAGDGGSVELAKRAGRALLVEPDPTRFKLLKLACERFENVSAYPIALASTAGHQRFFSQSLSRFGSTRKVTGARQLFRGLQLTGDSAVETTTLSNLVGGVKSEERLAVIIDAPSEVLVALEQLHEAGWLERAVAVQLKISELALHEGGADRASVEAWVNAKGYVLTPVSGRSDPDFFTAWLDLPSVQMPSEAEVNDAPGSAEDDEAEGVAEASEAEVNDASGSVEDDEAEGVVEASEASVEVEASEAEVSDAPGSVEDDEGASTTAQGSSNALREKLARLEGQYAVLEERFSDQTKLVQKHRSKAYRTTKRLEKSEAARDELAQRVTSLEARLAEEETARSEQVARIREQLHEREIAVKAAKDEARESERAASAAMQSSQQQIKALSAEREKLAHRVEKLQARLAEESSARSEQTARLREQLRESEEAASAGRRDAQEANKKALKVLSAERDSAIERSRKLEARLKALDETLSKRSRDEQTLRERCDALSDQLQAERQKYAEQAADSRNVARELAELKPKAKLIEDEKTGLVSRLGQLRTSVEETRALLDAERKARKEAEASLKALESELEAANAQSAEARDDLALTVRTQNMTQSDLQELQGRFLALAEEKRSLEELLGKLMDRLYDASERVEALSWAEAGGDDSRPGSTRRAKEK